MLQISSPGSDILERTDGWANLIDTFSAPLRESFANGEPLDFGALQRQLAAWEDVARDWDKAKLLEDHPNTLDEWERMRAMLWCVEYVQNTTLQQGLPAVFTELPASAPREVRDRADWSLAWVRILRGEASHKRIAVPIALANEMMRLNGGIATLVFDVFSPGRGRLTLHPEESFRILPDANFTESLNTAWRLTMKIAKSEDGQNDFPDVVWRVMEQSPSMSGLDEVAFFESDGLRWKGEIKGRSASGAAARAFRCFLRGTVLEPDVFVLAQVRKDVTPADQLEGVGGIPAKVAAIVRAGHPATIVVTEKDKAEADLVVSQEKANSRIDIEIDIPPAIRRSLEEAKKLSEEDRFADAIPVLEGALIAASQAKHRSAEAKIRILLGSALWEGREDVVGAEKQFRQALDLAGESPSSLLHSALHGLGDMLIRMGQLDEAGAVVHASLAVAKSLGKQDDVAHSLISLGLLEHNLGHADAARSYLVDAIGILQQAILTSSGDRRENNAHALAVCYQNKAQLERDDGRPEDALVLYAKVEELHRVSGDRLNAGKAHLLAGKLHCANADAEQGFQCFKRAMAVFVDLKNPLWMARTAAAMARLYAQHAQADESANTELWEEATKAALAAKDFFEKAEAVSEHIDGILFEADVLAHLVKAGLRVNVQKQIHDIFKRVPKEHEAKAAADISSQMDRIHAEIADKVRADEEVGRLLLEAHQLAEKHTLHKELAECYLAECRLRMAKDDNEGRKNLLEKAITALAKALEEAGVPQRRGHLMGELSALYRELGDRTQAATWLRRAGEIFEKAGDIFGLANYHGSMAEMHRASGSLGDEIASYRKVLELIEGRSFHQLAAGTRINLAAALRFRGDFQEAQTFLTEAEAICDRHQMKDFITAIARNRSEIETELGAGQAASHTLPQLLDSLHQLVSYKPENAVGYLAFWYYAWKTELMALLRSGPRLSLMVVTDDLERFIEYAATFSNLADHFLMATTTEPTVAAENGVLAIPPTWLFPASFTFVGIRKVKPDSGETAQGAQQDVEEGPPNLQLSGPAAMLPPYMLVSVESEVKGEGHVSTLSTPHLPAEAIELMTRRPIEELIQRRAVWFPSPRRGSKDAFLTDLRVAHERGLFPVYFDRLPISDGAAEIGGVDVRIPASALTPAGQGLTDKWKRALLKITRLQREDARVALFDLPDAFPTDNGAEKALQMEVHLFEFAEIGRKVIRPVLLVR